MADVAEWMALAQLCHFEAVRVLVVEQGLNRVVIQPDGIDEVVDANVGT